MSDEVEDIGAALFRHGQIVRDEWWASYVAAVDRIMSELRAGRQFAGEFSHLLPQAPQSMAAMAQPPPLPQHEAESHSQRGRNPVWDQMFGPGASG